MLGPMKMLGCVLILGRITTAYVATAKAKTKMYPTVAHFQALFAALRVRLNILDLIEVRAFGHVTSLDGFYGQPDLE